MEFAFALALAMLFALEFALALALSLVFVFAVARIIFSSFICMCANCHRDPRQLLFMFWFIIFCSYSSTSSHISYCHFHYYVAGETIYCNSRMSEINHKTKTCIEHSNVCREIMTFQNVYAHLLIYLSIYIFIYIYIYIYIYCASFCFSKKGNAHVLRTFK